MYRIFKMYVFSDDIYAVCDVPIVLYDDSLLRNFMKTGFSIIKPRLRVIVARYGHKFVQQLSV
jgi:hypothetical protein